MGQDEIVTQKDYGSQVQMGWFPKRSASWIVSRVLGLLFAVVVWLLWYHKAEVSVIFNWVDLLPVLLLVVACWGIKRAPKGEFFEEPLNKRQGLALRGVFACVVMMFHLSLWRLGDDSCLFARFGFWGSASVAIFLGLSGYGLVTQAETRPDYMKGFWPTRLKSLLGPYCLMTLLCGIQVWRGDMKWAEQLYLQLGLVHFGWFFAVLLGFYLVFWLGYHNTAFPLNSRGVMSCLGTFCLTVLLQFYSEKTDYLFISNGAFVAGIWLGHGQGKKFKYFGKCWWFVMAIMGIIILINCSQGWHERHEADRLTTFLCNTLFFVSIAILGMKVQFSNCVLTWLGKISYELYLTHGWLMYELRHWWPGLKGTGYVYAVVAGNLAMASALHCVVRWVRHRWGTEFVILRRGRR
jgi:peptidoglycan/LPS O-acetylase OafA/YrhL